MTSHPTLICAGRQDIYPAKAILWSQIHCISCHTLPGNCSGRSCTKKAVSAGQEGGYARRAWTWALHHFCVSGLFHSSMINGQQLFPELIYVPEPLHHPLDSHLSSGEFDICPQRAHPTGADAWQSHPPWLVQAPLHAGKRPDVWKKGRSGFQRLHEC